MSKNDKKEPKCSFCGHPAYMTEQLLSGPDDVHICNKCVEACAEMVGLVKPEPEKEKGFSLENLETVPSPRQIMDHLDRYVIGHSYAKRVLSVAVHNHYKRLKHSLIDPKDNNLPESLKDVEIEKSNILLMGPTGSGKTLLAKTLAKMLDVPFAIADATTLTEAGYVGEDVENILLNLIRNADMDIEKAEHGIIYVDEIDKIGKRTGNVSITRDVSGEGVQQALLKIIEGTIARVPPAGGRKHPEQKYIEINTGNILFICGGAFVGLQDIIHKRHGAGSLGFAQEYNKANEEEQTNEIETEDLIQFGLIPEFVGRLPVIASLKELSKEELLEIITKPNNSIVKQFKKLMAIDGIQLTFDKAALNEIAEIAIAKKTGARGLRSIFEKIMLNIMFDSPESKNPETIRITKKYMKEILEA
ncbi:MAG: ATP-dependent Clp protease ATP-binding subunit ClpX [Kiritimatiellae bacterium]|jgi:ATP-dependent Clp protease ATP-binding subunit ClpX|nr:ATP-dependent Clp protease ATP-binding subunit ClpX [Kiritimatiellia bacterium]